MSERAAVWFILGIVVGVTVMLLVERFAEAIQPGQVVP